MPPEDPPEQPIHDSLPDDPWTGETDSRQDGEALARLILDKFRSGMTLGGVDLSGKEEVTIDFALGFVDTLCADPWWMGERSVVFRNIEGCANWTLLREQLAAHRDEELRLLIGPPHGIYGLRCPALAAERLRARRLRERQARKEGQA